MNMLSGFGASMILKQSESRFRLAAEPCAVSPVQPVNMLFAVVGVVDHLILRQV